MKISQLLMCFYSEIKLSTGPAASKSSTSLQLTQIPSGSALNEYHFRSYKFWVGTEDAS